MKELLDYLKQITDLQYMINILSWDLRISTPEDAKDDLIKVITDLEEKLFKLQTSEEYKKILSHATMSEEYKKLPESEKRYIDNLSIRYFENEVLPVEFVTEYSSLCKKSTEVWSKAREVNDYNVFKPYLEKVIEMTKKYYSYLSSDEDDLYNTMLDCYERGITKDIIDPLFRELKEYLIDLIKNVKSNKKVIEIDYTDDELLECAKFLLDYIGFDLKRGHVSIYHHGFTEKMSANDVRLAFRSTKDPIDFVTTVVHEGGHGIFEQSIDDNLWKYSNGTIENLYALHESQSRFYENFLGRRKSFWEPIYDEIKKMLKLDIDLDEFIELLNNVNLGLIRVDADELTYCLHIIIRYEIEREIFDGNISVDDLPELWNQKMKEYFGLDVLNDRDGLMQDIHWGEGNFGYFPSYLLGNIYDGMFYEAIKKDLGDIDSILSRGGVKDITKYLNDNIHQYGGSYTYKEVIDHVCKCKELSIKPLINYYKEKYDK